MNKRIKKKLLKKKYKLFCKFLSEKIEEAIGDNYLFENNKEEIILDIKTLKKVE